VTITQKALSWDKNEKKTKTVKAFKKPCMTSRVAPDYPFFLREFYKKRLITKKSIFDKLLKISLKRTISQRKKYLLITAIK
jgi:hypothetical protein